MSTIRFALALLVILGLAACQIEGGVARPGTPTAADATQPPPIALDATQPPTEESTATAAPTAAAGSELRIGLLSDPGDLLPFHNDSADERATAPITELIFPAPLLPVSYAYTTTGVLQRVPSLENGDVALGTVDVFLDSSGVITTTATETITQVQQISVTFRWNPALRWADGQPVTAADSLFAYELARQADLGQEVAARLALLDRYEQVDEHTTRAVLKPDFTDPAYLTTFFTPLPRHLLQSVSPAELRTAEYALLPQGYGPYTVERRDQTTLRLRRNPHFPGPTGPELVSFVFRDSLEQLRSSVAGGSLDVVAADALSPDETAAAQADAAAGALQLGAVANPIWEHLDFNLDVPLLQDIRVRRAIAQAVDRQAMVDTLLGGYPPVLDSWVVPGQWAAAPADQLTRYPFNPDEARRLLDEGGFVDGDGDGRREAAGQPITLTLTTTAGSPLRRAVAERMQADLAAVGLGLEIQELPTAELYSQAGPLYRRTFQLALFAWIAAPDPRGWERWSCVGVPNEGNGYTGNNFAGWCFFEADQAIRTATTSLDQAARAQAYLRQQQLFTQELPVLPLFQRVDLTMTTPSLAGVQPDPTAPFTWNLATWRRK